MSLLNGIPVRPLSKIKIEKAVLQYLEQYQPVVLGEPRALDVEYLLTVSISKSHGYKQSIVKKIDVRNVEARAIIQENIVEITEACFEDLDRPSRARFTVCHEIGHVLLHSDQLLQYVLEPARMPQHAPKIYEDPEWQAEHAGGALLMPLITISPYVDRLRMSGVSAEEIIDRVANTFMVSIPAARTRIKQISQADLASLAKNFRRNLEVPR